MVLWEKGAEVFPNKGCSGKVDMVAEINGTYYPIDVKVDKWNPYTGVFGCTRGAAPGVWLVCINPDTKRIRWPYKGNSRVTLNCPEGLEDFWD